MHLIKAINLAKNLLILFDSELSQIFGNNYLNHELTIYLCKVII